MLNIDIAQPALVDGNLDNALDRCKHAERLYHAAGCLQARLCNSRIYVVESQPDCVLVRNSLRRHQIVATVSA